jgi:CRP/FNR family transcriptional regulator
LSINSIIKSLDFFASLSDSQVNQLAKISTVNSYNKEYILYYENSKIDSLLFLTNGLAKSYKIDKNNNEIFLYFIYNNSMLSEISTIYSDSLYSYSNISFIEKSQVLSIDYKLFKDNFLQQNLLNLEFMNEIILRSSKLESLINREILFEAVAKVSMMLSSDLNMFNKFKRQDISLILNIQPATLSRVLNRLKRNGIIHIDQGKVSILNRDKLDLIYKELM